MMGCRQARDHLVAWQDGELSPGDATRLEEHLAACAACRGHERRLAAATPDPRQWSPPLQVRIPEAVKAELDRRLSIDVLLAAAEASDPAAPTWSERLSAWMSGELRMPVGWAVAYLVLLGLAIGFGVSGRWSAPAPAPSVSGIDLPADQFQPASFDPEDDDGIQ